MCVFVFVHHLVRNLFLEEFKESEIFIFEEIIR